ncbi:hypothetical protein NIES25_69900 (plasmid) [Nostoc linckia NIES-25]|nr:hypothetical protein NIES25_69900 [Nostoc linckia NIES-25]
MNFLPQVAAAFAPAAMNAVGQAVGGAANAAMGNTAGRVAGAGLNSNPVFDTLQRAGVQLDPNQQAQLANHYARESGQDSMNQQMQAASFAAGLANTGNNLSTQRQMALNQQANAAQNVANQLNALSQARQSNAQAISNAMSAGMAAFR